MYRSDTDISFLFSLRISHSANRPPIFRVLPIFRPFALLRSCRRLRVASFHLSLHLASASFRIRFIPLFLRSLLSTRSSNRSLFLFFLPLSYRNGEPPSARFIPQHFAAATNPFGSESCLVSLDSSLGAANEPALVF